MGFSRVISQARKKRKRKKKEKGSWVLLLHSRWGKREKRFRIIPLPPCPYPDKHKVSILQSLPAFFGWEFLRCCRCRCRQKIICLPPLPTVHFFASWVVAFLVLLFLSFLPRLVLISMHGGRGKWEGEEEQEGEEDERAKVVLTDTRGHKHLEKNATKNRFLVQTN